MALVCLNVFPLPAGTEGLPVEGTGKTLQEGKRFCRLLLVGPLSRLLQHTQLSPAPASWSITGSPVPCSCSTRWPPAPSGQQLLPGISHQTVKHSQLLHFPVFFAVQGSQQAAPSGQQLPLTPSLTYSFVAECLWWLTFPWTTFFGTLDGGFLAGSRKQISSQFHHSMSHDHNFLNKDWISALSPGAEGGVGAEKGLPCAPYVSHAHAFLHLLEHKAVLTFFVYWIDHLGHFLWIIFHYVGCSLLLLFIPDNILLLARYCIFCLVEG